MTPAVQHFSIFSIFYSNERLEACQHSVPYHLESNTVRLCRWLKPGKEFGHGCITVVGDALHPMTPSLGQGGCIALEVRMHP